MAEAQDHKLPDIYKDLNNTINTTDNTSDPINSSKIQVIARLNLSDI